MSERTVRVLVIDDDPTTADVLADFLAARRYEVVTCRGIAHARDLPEWWRPRVLVLVPTLEEERHEQLGELRRIYPRIPVVVVTASEDQELLLDLEAFPPTLPAKPSKGLGHIESAVLAASSLA